MLFSVCGWCNVEGGIVVLVSRTVHWYSVRVQPCDAWLHDATGTTTDTAAPRRINRQTTHLSTGLYYDKFTHHSEVKKSPWCHKFLLLYTGVMPLTVADKYLMKYFRRERLTLQRILPWRFSQNSWSVFRCRRSTFFTYFTYTRTCSKATPT